ncbi:subtilisin family serine protease [Hamadaea flava]|uniref:S8 family peptidase n=1 Tax=Hamadaea flava TaxID=1742688 RepID=A0ABV8LLK6_9ACTN|nr:subtilisin family serine protease [Hamadaea flava]
MKPHRVLAAAFAVAAAVAFSTPAQAAPAEGTVLYADPSTAISGSYIVVLRDSAATASAVPTKAKGLVGRYGGTTGRVYTAALHGFEVNLTERAARRLAADPAVDYVQQNETVSLAETQTPVPSWGLDRIDQRALPLDNAYTYANTGAGVKAYIIDTGIRLTHADFGGRAISGIDTVDNDNDATDCHGHGTHVAGTVGGSSYGVGKGVTLVAVRVMSCTGGGTTAGIIAGIDWVTADHTTGPAVANISISGSTSKPMDAAITNSIADGVTYAVAAGNLFGSNACGYSPARVPNAITVGNTTPTDARAASSNIGKCLDIFAPGTDITSAGITSDTASSVKSGTSMASPHVAGAAALVLAAHPGFTPQQVGDYLVDSATQNVVSNAGTGSPNRLLFIG